tara:strand:+ start:457 stop:681 length:225 start_codon:yes stop_codon:yes gene_type:complete
MEHLLQELVVVEVQETLLVVVEQVVEVKVVDQSLDFQELLILVVVEVDQVKMVVTILVVLAVQELLLLDINFSS